MGSEEDIEMRLSENDWPTGTPAKVFSYWADDSRRPSLNGSTLSASEGDRRGHRNFSAGMDDKTHQGQS